MSQEEVLDEAPSRPASARQAAPSARSRHPVTDPDRGLWQLAWPSMAAFALQASLSFVDMLFVARLGGDAVAGVGVGSQMHFIVPAVLAAVITGTVALVARECGANRNTEAAQVLQVSLVLTASIGLLFSLAAPWAPFAIALFGTSSGVASIGADYLSILLVGSVPFAVGITLASAMRGAGDVHTPLLIGAVINAINLVFDYVLIFGNWGAPAWGAPGSAAASVIAFTIGAAVYLLLWLSGRLALARVPLELDGERCRRIVRIGVPTALEQLLFNGGLFLFVRVIAGFGTEAVSAYMIGVRILAFSFVPGLGFATAAATMVGQQLGANDPEEAARAGWRATGGAMAVLSSAGLAIVLCAEPLVSAFGDAGARTTELATSFIYILAAAQPLMAIEFALAGALRGAGDTRFPLLAFSAGLFIFRLGGALVILSVYPGSVVAVWSCLLADYIVKAAMLAERFRRGAWKRIEI